MNSVLSWWLTSSGCWCRSFDSGGVVQVEKAGGGRARRHGRQQRVWHQGGDPFTHHHVWRVHRLAALAMILVWTMRVPESLCAPPDIAAEKKEADKDSERRGSGQEVGRKGTPPRLSGRNSEPLKASGDSPEEKLTQPEAKSPPTRNPPRSPGWRQGRTPHPSAKKSEAKRPVR